MLKSPLDIEHFQIAGDFTADQTEAAGCPEEPVQLLKRNEVFLVFFPVDARGPAAVAFNRDYRNRDIESDEDFGRATWSHHRQPSLLCVSKVVQFSGCPRDVRNA